jgi:hypothetical protein
MIEGQLVQWGLRLLIGAGSFLVGRATKFGDLWITNRIHTHDEQRAKHHEDLREKILTPLRDGLATHFKPLVALQVPMINIQHAAKEYSDDAKVTEEPSKWGPVMVVPFPSAMVFGPLPSVLLEDARKNHYAKLMRSVDTFVNGYLGFAGELHRWVSRIAKQILTDSGLPMFPNPNQGPYVMHYRLAKFVYLRTFRFETGVLRTEVDGQHSLLKGGDYTLAVGSADQIAAQVEHLNRLIDSEAAMGASLREKGGVLHSRFNDLLGEIEFAIASQRLYGRCDLVSSF